MKSPEDDFFLGHTVLEKRTVSREALLECLFMMAQERNRYRFVPHIFHGYGYGEGGPITDIDMQKVSASLKSDEATTTRPTAPYTPPAVTIPPLTTPPAVTTPPPP